MTEPRVSIIILNWNGLEDTIECLESLKQITYPNYDVIVVDNGSAGNDAEALNERFGQYIHVIENDRNYGFAEGNNIAIGHALASGADYVLLLNNDTVVDACFLSELVDVAESESSIAIVGAKTYLYDDPNRIQLAWIKMSLWRGRAFHIGSMEIDRGQYDTITEVDCVQGSCFLVKRQAVEKLGLLDARYFYLWEEADYCFRAKRAGYKVVYAPGAKIWHKVSRAGRKSMSFYQYYFTRNGFWFMKRHATRWQFLCSVLLFFVRRFWFVSGVLLIYRRDVKSLLSFYQGIKDGILRA